MWNIRVANKRSASQWFYPNSIKVFRDWRANTIRDHSENSWDFWVGCQWISQDQWPPPWLQEGTNRIL